MNADVFPVVASLHPSPERSDDRKYVCVRRLKKDEWIEILFFLKAALQNNRVDDSKNSIRALVKLASYFNYKLKTNLHDL